MTKVLRARELHTYYSKSHILHGVSLEVNEGEIVTLLGRNGAGKTTTVRSLMGLTPPRSGNIEMFGKDTTRWPPHRIAGLGVGYVPEGRKIFGGLTVLENLKVPPARGRILGHQPGVQAVSPTRRAEIATRPPAVGRRTGNVGNCEAPPA